MAASSSVLPTVQRYINGVPVPQGRKTLRLREKYVIILVFVTFSTVCFGAFFFLPDLRDRVSVEEVRRHLQQAGGEIFIPQARIGPDGVPIAGGNVFRHNPDEVVDTHRLIDKMRLKDKIEAEWNQKHVLQPPPPGPKGDKNEEFPAEVFAGKKDDTLRFQRGHEQSIQKEEIKPKEPGQSDSQTRVRREKVKEVR